MKLDGFRPTDKVAAFERGITKTYVIPAPYGPKEGPAKLKVTFKYAGTGNAEYMAALGRAEDADARLLAIHDSCVLAWESNLQVGGKDIQPTAENFVALMKVDADEVAGPLRAMVSDIFDRQNFVEQKRAESEKN